MTCNKDVKEAKNVIMTEFREVHVHDNHTFDLNYLIIQFLNYPPDLLRDPNKNLIKSKIPCLDEECMKVNRCYDLNIKDLMEGYLPIHYDIVYDKEDFGILTKEEIAKFNIFLYRYYSEIIEAEIIGDEKIDAELIQGNRKKAIMRSYVHTTDKPLIKPERTMNEKYWTLKSNIPEAIKNMKYPEKWDTTKNIEKPVTLREMDQGNDPNGYKEATDLLLKSVQNSKNIKCSMIQNPKHWELYNYTKESVGQEIILAIIPDLYELSKLDSNMFLLSLVGKVKQKGRAVYLTIPEHVSKLIKPNEKGKYTVVYAKVLLGDEDPDKDGVSLSYKDPNKFLKYGHKKYDDNGSTMYAIYNLSQVYPMYAVEYTL